MSMATSSDQHPEDGSSRAQALSAGFTLLELLVVMGIMVTLMTAGIGGYFQMRRGAEMRGAISTVRNTLMLGRQQAVTKHRNVQVFFRVASNTVEVTEIQAGVPNRVHAPSALPPGIKFTSASDIMVAFSPLGGAGGAGTTTISLIEKTAGKGGVQSTAAITVWSLTGVTEVTTAP